MADIRDILSQPTRAARRAAARAAGADVQRQYQQHEYRQRLARFGVKPGQGGTPDARGHTVNERVLPILPKGSQSFRNVPLNLRDSRKVGRWLRATRGVVQGNNEALHKLGTVTVTDQQTGQKITLESQPGAIAEALAKRPAIMRDFIQRGGGYGERQRGLAERFELEPEDLEELSEDELDELEAELEAEELEREE